MVFCRFLDFACLCATYSNNGVFWFRFRHARAPWRCSRRAAFFQLIGGIKHRSGFIYGGKNIEAVCVYVCVCFFFFLFRVLCI